MRVSSFSPASSLDPPTPLLMACQQLCQHASNNFASMPATFCQHASKPMSGCKYQLCQHASNNFASMPATRASMPATLPACQQLCQHASNTCQHASNTCQHASNTCQQCVFVEIAATHHFVPACQQLSCQHASNFRASMPASQQHCSGGV